MATPSSSMLSGTMGFTKTAFATLIAAYALYYLAAPIAFAYFLILVVELGLHVVSPTTHTSSTSILTKLAPVIAGPVRGFLEYVRENANEHVMPYTPLWSAGFGGGEVDDSDVTDDEKEEGDDGLDAVVEEDMYDGLADLFAQE